MVLTMMEGARSKTKTEELKNEQSGYWYILTSGIGPFSPGIFRLGYEGGGPYLCIAINQGGGTVSDV